MLVVLPVLLVALAGCSTAASGGGSGGGVVPDSASGAPTSVPDSQPGIQCDAVAKSFTDQAKSQGNKFTYAAVDPSTIIGVQGLPAAVLETGCFVSADKKVAYALIPVKDSTTFEALAAILVASGYVQDDSQNIDRKTEHSFYNTDKSLPTSEYQVGALDVLTVDRLRGDLLPADLFKESDGLMLYVFAGMH